MWIVEAGGPKFTTKTEKPEDAITEFLSSDICKNHLGMIIEIYKPGDKHEDRLCFLSVRELLIRHLVTNKDAMVIMRDMLGFEPVDDMKNADDWLDLLRDNARWFKENSLPG